MSTRSGLVVVLLTIVVILVPRPLWAHARLVKSAPAANARLTVLPTFIRLWFSEAPELPFTRIVLTDSAGKPVSVGSVERDESKLAVRFRVNGELTVGRYTVKWKTAATDGHPSQGSFNFIVLPEAIRVVVPAAAADSPAAASANEVVGPHQAAGQAQVEPTAETVAYVAARAVSFAALLSLIGVVAFRGFVLGRITESEDEKLRVRRLAARIGMFASVGVVIAACLRLYLQADMMADVDRSTSSMISMTVTQTQWGRVWGVQMIAALVALIAFALIRRGRDGGWWIAAVAALVLSATSAFAGHAAAAANLSAVSIAVDTLHVLSASAWLGSLLCVLLVGTSSAGSSAGSSSGERGERVKSIVNAFSPTALIAASLVVVTGGVSAWLRLGSVSALWTSGYGRVLLLKLAALSGVLATGAFNWLRVRPTLGTDVSTSRLHRSASVELAIGCLVLIATAVLVAMPTPLDVGN